MAVDTPSVRELLSRFVEEKNGPALPCIQTMIFNRVIEKKRHIVARRSHGVSVRTRRQNVASWIC